MTFAAFFLTTGRSGTQSLAHYLRESYSDVARVEHEPIGAGYHPKHYLGQEPSSADLEANPRVAEHLRDIKIELEERNYIEVGWPSFAWAPFLEEFFDGSSRFVHLVRNPVRVALSLTTHGFYQPAEVDNEYTRTAQLDPRTPGVHFRGYVHRWAGLTPYEKCLFQWLEINTFALKIGETLEASRFRTVRLEDLTDSSKPALASLIEFLTLPLRNGFIKGVQSRPIDSFGWVKDEIVDWRLVFNHPDVVELARKLGYDFTSVSERGLRRRYSPRPRPVLAKLKHWQSSLSQRVRAVVSRLLG